MAPGNDREEDSRTKVFKLSVLVFFLDSAFVQSLSLILSPTFFFFFFYPVVVIFVPCNLDISDILDILHPPTLKSKTEPLHHNTDQVFSFASRLWFLLIFSKVG